MLSKLEAVHRVSRVNSQSKIGNAVISTFQGTPLGSGVMKQTPTMPPAPDNLPHPLRTLVGGGLQTTGDECRRAMAIVESATEANKKVGSASPEGFMQYFPQMDKGSPLVILTILAGDFLTITFVLFWLFRWR
jgi:hypothetical protein